MRYTIATFILVLMTGCGSHPAAPAGAFEKFVDDYYDASFAASPTSGTAVGLHQYDSKIDDLSAAAMARRAAVLKEFQTRLAALRQGSLTDSQSIDAEVLDGQIKSQLLDLEVLHDWERNPMNYVGLPGGAVDLLIQRDFAPAADRLRSVIARLKGIPAIFDAMRANVKNPPREFTELAIRMCRGSVGFFKGTVAMWAKNAAGPDKAMLEEFTQANDKVIRDVEEAAKWLETDLLPRSNGKYAIGPENFAKKLEYDEMVGMPLDRVLAIGEANLAKDHDAFVETAKEIKADAPAMAVMKTLSGDHPTEANLIESAKATIEEARQFLVDHDIVTIPSEVRPTIEETPPYARSGSFASMNTPGPFEKAKEAFYYVTPVEKNWTAKQKNEHLRLFNPPVMKMITVHEAYPGHYLQFLYAKQFPTKVRKLSGTGTNAEGWAHYAEQMMLEQGFGGGDPKIRLAQLSEALVRDCRYVVGIKLHTAGMTVAQGAEMFEKQCFQEPIVSFEEARRGTYNPTYLYYTLGKLEIYKLREDYRKEKGTAYSLKAFHDDFVRQGALPIPLMRRLMLKDSRGPVI